jgi:hypothetical protein
MYVLPISREPGRGSTAVVRSPTVVPATSLSPPTTIQFSADTPSGPPPICPDDPMPRRSSKTRAPVLFQPDMREASRWKSDMVVNAGIRFRDGVLGGWLIRLWET